MKLQVMSKIIMEEGFLNYIFVKNKRILLISFIIQVAYLCVYKYCIPMPDFFSDSHSYVLAANRNMPLYYRPLGYSNFLSFLHIFSSSDLFVIVVQYFLLTFSTMFLLFSIDYLYGFQNRKIKILAFALTALNPILLVLANQIASDSLFSFYTILWFSFLLWILKEGKWWALILQVIILYLAFKVRYQALFFPAISIVIFILSAKSKFHYKIIGIFFSLVFISYAHKQEKEIVQKQVQADVFAGFSGWMMANNALLIYKYTNTQTNDFIDPDLVLLDKFVKANIDSISQGQKDEIEKYTLSWPYLWNPKAPLKQYLFYYMQTYKVPYFQAWYQVSPLYYEYGKEVILNNPLIYLQHFVLPNIRYFFIPRRYEMEKYSYDGVETVPIDTKEWFAYNSDILKSNYPKIQSLISASFSPFYVIVMIVSLVSPFFFYKIIFKKQKDVNMKDFRNLLLFWIDFYIINMGFNVLAGPIVLRYQIAIYIIGALVSLFLIDRMIVFKQNAKSTNI